MRRTLLAIALLVLALAGCASTPESETRVVHVLQPGENLYRLSRYYGVSVGDIAAANDIDDVTDIPIGARLVIPGTARKPPPASVAAYEPSGPSGRAPSARAAGLDFAWPVRGTLSSRYGWRSGSHHEGIDISARRGTPVRAAEAGRVIYSGWLGSYGRVVIVKHVGAWSTVYAHNQRNRVEEGDFVERGDVVAEVGTSGNASGPHVHFEVRRDRAPEDPLAYLP
jgi:murein DD-endopeptidase MepM/ murein hydrolase activator NlpD